MHTEYFEKIHKECSNHVLPIKSSKLVGCFHCKFIYPPKDIMEWTDSDTTAICPHCGVDAVLPYMDDINRNHTVLLIMHTMYFRGEPKLTKELHASVYDYIQNGPIEVNAKTLLHMYLFMLEYVDVLDNHVTLRGFVELFKAQHVELPKVLKEFDSGDS